MNGKKIIESEEGRLPEAPPPFGIKPPSITKEEENAIFESENENIPLAKQRYDICKGCENLTSLKFCSQCGCFMPLKVRIESVSCPIKKW
jgi:hypothetical protein